MTNNEDLFRDTFDNLNNVATIEESAIHSSGLLLSKEETVGDIPLVDAAAVDSITARSAYVLTLPRDSFNVLQNAFLTLPFFKTSEKPVLNSSELPSKKQKDDEQDSSELLSKKQKTDIQEEENIKEALAVMQKTIMDKLQAIESRLDDVTTKCQNLEQQVDSILEKAKSPSVDNRHAFTFNKRSAGPLVVGVPSRLPGSHSSFCEEGCSTCLIALNSEADYPNGSWLGDPDNPEMRVRCNISPKDLDYCNRMCTSPEKMSLTLLDCLFDREVQACSNISGTGKHGKKQLDPLKIYGIRCHLIHMFGITEKDWHRMRQNLDSKCRTAFRRKQKGMPLIVKGFRERPISLHDSQDLSNHADKCSQTAVTSVTMPEIILSEDFMGSESVPSTKNIDASSIIPVKIESSGIDAVSLQIQEITDAQIIHMEQKDIQVLHATFEQFAALNKEGHDLQILADGNILNEKRIPDVPPT